MSVDDVAKAAASQRRQEKAHLKRERKQKRQSDSERHIDDTMIVSTATSHQDKRHSVRGKRILMSKAGRRAGKTRIRHKRTRPNGVKKKDVRKKVAVKAVTTHR